MTHGPRITRHCIWHFDLQSSLSKYHCLVSVKRIIMLQLKVGCRVAKVPPVGDNKNIFCPQWKFPTCSGRTRQMWPGGAGRWARVLWLVAGPYYPTVPTHALCLLTSGYVEAVLARLGSSRPRPMWEELRGRGWLGRGQSSREADCLTAD